MKKCLAFLLTVLMFGTTAMAEAYRGSTAVLQETYVTAPTDGVVDVLDAEPGEVVLEGDRLAVVKAQRIYATQDGVVAAVWNEAGEKADGTVLELQPVSLYTIYCTADNAYKTPETMFVESGETLYVKCTRDGSHRAVGRVYSVNGAEYRLEVLGGELYIGETVNLYRSESLENASRVGVGTVVASDVEAYSAEGTILRLRVNAGDHVEKGQLLFTYTAEGDGEIKAEKNGIILAYEKIEGTDVKKDDVVLRTVALDQIGLKVYVDEKKVATIAPGDVLTYVELSDPAEAEKTAKVLSVSHVEEENGYLVTLMPEELQTMIGLSVELIID